MQTHCCSIQQKYKTRLILVIFISILGLSAIFSDYPFRAVNAAQESMKSSVAPVPGELLIRWRDIPDLNPSVLLSDFSNSLTVTDSFDNYTLCTISDSGSYSQILESLLAHPDVLGAEPNYELTLFNEDTSSIMPTKNHAFDSMDVEEGWKAFSDTVKDPKPVIVAIIDTGCDILHPDLVNQIWTNIGEIAGDGIDNDRNGYIDDVHGWDFYNQDATVCHYEKNEATGLMLADPADIDNHGTHIAGVIGAVSGSDTGVTGIASNIPVVLMPLKIHGGETGKGSVANAVKAIRYATMMGADICNMSWGSRVYSELLESAMRESDMLFVVAAGNEGTNNNAAPMYPSSCNIPNMLSTTFVDRDLLLTTNSNYGVSTVDIAAPGTDIYSTVVGSYATMSGSSMAVPYVCGIAALIYSTHDNLYASNVKDLIINTLQPVDALAGQIRYPGIPSLPSVVGAIDTLSTDTEAPSIYLSSGYLKDFLTITAIGEDFGGSQIRTLRYAYGKKSLKAFQRGTQGTAIKTDSITLAKSGNYTFYAGDYAGNETLVHFFLADDVKKPEAEISFVSSNDGSTYSVFCILTDDESGVKEARLLPGIHSIENYPAGNVGQKLISNEERFLLHLNETDSYTLFFTDYRGNKASYPFDLFRLPATGISLSATELTLMPGETYQLTSVLSPEFTTEYLAYSSSSPELVRVNNWGGVTALAPGTAEITVATGNGLSAICHVTVQ